jgi:hypothetical protein
MFLILGCPYCQLDGGHADDCEFITALRAAGLIDSQAQPHDPIPLPHHDDWTPPWRRT